MKPVYLLALLCLTPLSAQADIYKSVDADGHVTYSSAPLKGGKRIIETPDSSAPAPVRARSSASPKDFPKVTQETQKGRDQTRLKILEDELKIEQLLLSKAKRELQAGEADPKIARNKDRLNELTSEVALHQGNVDALNTEISKLK